MPAAPAERQRRVARNAAARDHQIMACRRGRQGVGNRLGPIRQDAEVVDVAAETLEQARKAVAVGIEDLSGAEIFSRLPQLVAG